VSTIVHFDFAVPGVGRARPTFSSRSDTGPPEVFGIDFGTFGKLTIDDFADQVTRWYRWISRLGDRWIVDLAGVGDQVGSEWPATWRGKISLPQPRLLHGKTNHYGVISDITQVTFVIPLAAVELSMKAKIFLSHKGVDKTLVRGYFDTLRLLEFEPWLDEDAMVAGAELERTLLRGFADSCAAVFFVTPAFKDESYLATEVNYAVAQRREKGDRFQIISLVFANAQGIKGTVPDLLRQYVWKEPTSDLEAIQEILRALPVQTGPVSWRTVP